MTPNTFAPAPTAISCPACAAALTGAVSCPACGLRLTGPDAARLWEVDLALLRLDAQRGALQAERRSLLASLRGEAPAPTGPFAPPPTHPFGPGAGVPVGAPAVRTTPEWTPRRVQNLLLLLGGLLLAVAATVFTAVTYDRLGAGGRAAILLALTAAAAAAAPRLRARGLNATAETVATVALALAALDAYGLRRLGLGADLHDVTWLAATSGTLAAASGAYAGATRLRLPAVAAVALANTALLLAVVRIEPSVTSTSVLLALIAGLNLGAVAALVRQDRSPAQGDLLVSTVVTAALVGGLALVAALVAVGSDGQEAALAFVACAVLSAVGAVVARPGSLRTALGALPVLLLTGAAVTLGLDSVDAHHLPLVAAGMALAALPLAALLPFRDRAGPVCGALVVAAGSAAGVLEHVVSGLAGPATWLVAPWSLPSGAGARAALSPEFAWTGSATVLAVLVVLACVVAGAGLQLDRPEPGAAAAGVLGTVAALLLPVGVDLPYPFALLLLLVLATALLAAADALRTAGRPLEGLGVLGAAGAAAGLAALWSLADQGSTLAVLPVVALLLSVAAVRPGTTTVQAVAAGLACLVAGAELAAAGAARDLAVEQVGGLLLLAPLVLLVPLVLLSLFGLPTLDEARRRAVETAAAVLTTVAVVLATPDVGWLSWTLGGAGLLALATALAPDRRLLAPAGGLLLIASSWVRLADAGVDAPEPYVVPLAALALLLGHLRFRRDERVRSMAAYGPGLGLLLLPSLLAALADSGLARPLLVGAAALVVLLVGAQTRLQAPLAFGGGSLAVVALDLLAPYASAVPRWTALAAVGTLLVVVGATFEQRRREIEALRERYDALR